MTGLNLLNDLPFLDQMESLHLKMAIINTCIKITFKFVMIGERHLVYNLLPDDRASCDREKSGHPDVNH